MSRSKAAGLLGLVAVALLSAASLIGLSWGQSERTEALSFKLATLDDWPVFFEVQINGTLVALEDITGGTDGDDVFGGRTILTRVPLHETRPVAIDVFWGEFQTGMAYRADLTVARENIAFTYLDGGLDMTIAVGPFGRLSIWGSQKTMRDFPPGSDELRAHLASNPELIKQVAVLRVCGERTIEREEEFATFLDEPPLTSNKGLIDQEIVDREMQNLGPCDPSRTDGL